MLEVLVARWKQGYRTMRYPAGPPPELPERFVGSPILDASQCAADCRKCAEACPTGAIALGQDGRVSHLDMGRCLFCRECQTACESGAVRFTRNHRLAASQREDLMVGARLDVNRGAGVPPAEAAGTAAPQAQAAGTAAPQKKEPAVALNAATRRLFGRSLKLRQVSAGGCNACEADTNVLTTIGWDLGRFGVQFVASPRHADGLLITGPVTENMRAALEMTYDAVPWPKLVIAVGACAISGGPYIDHREAHNGAAGTVPVDLFIPGCPPHPLTILDGILRLLGRIA